MNILALHPVLQICTVVTVCWVFALGVKRFLQLHMKKNVVFPWRRHVFWGKTALILVVLGYLSGSAVVYTTFRVFGFTGMHHAVAEILAPLLVFGFGTGLYMDSRKKKRRVMNLLHGATNLCVLLLFAVQIFSGFRLVILYFLGR